MESPTQPIEALGAFIRELREALEEDLPGTAAQMKMAPAQRQMEPLSTVPPRQSAVLALLHPSPEGLALFFTVRSNSLRHHGGQISFPGGGVEAQDLTAQDTALRETEEELGFSTEGVDVLGKLTPLFIAPSQNIVHPYVGWTPEQPTLHPDPAEVASVLIVPIEDLLDPETQSSCTWRLDGRELSAPCFAVKQATIWGATAMMLSELIAVIQSVPTGVPALAPERVRRCAPPDRKAELQ